MNARKKDFAAKRLALCTTIYPGVEPYLRDWHAALLHQTDQDFQLWIALDGLSVDQVALAMGVLPDAVWIHAEAGDTPAMIRQRVLAPLTREYDGVVLVDSDDLMHPGRVAAARADLEKFELVACALRLVDQAGRDLGQTFSLPSQTAPDSILPRHNVFGLSNTAWRCAVLAKCLPIPAEVEIVDWFLATRAWLMGAELGFDPVIGMDYRQHTSNMVRTCGSIDSRQVIRDTERVRRHFRLIRAAPPEGAIQSRLIQISREADDIERFAALIIPSPELLDKYTCALNKLGLAPMWWSSVANPALKQLWSD